MKKREMLAIFVLLLLIFSISISAHGEENEKPDLFSDKVSEMKTQALWFIIIASIIVTLFTIISIMMGGKIKNKTKQILFLGISIPIIIATIFSAGTTIYLNTISATNGPVHWHADIEMWNCGEKINLIDPTSLSNRMGNPILHEHNDDRIHVEGVLLQKKDASLHTFIEVVGGKFTNEGLIIPTNDGLKTLKNGEECNGKPGQVQIFSYKIQNPDNGQKWEYEQTKVDENYILSPYAYVPPGDCIIIEFSEEKQKTDKICETFKVAEQRGDLSGS